MTVMMRWLLPKHRRALISGRSLLSLLSSKTYRLYINTLRRHADNNVLCKRLMSIPGIGYTIATALVASIGNGSQFKSPRELAVWIGLTPKGYASGEKSRLGGITKRGNRYICANSSFTAPERLCGFVAARRIDLSQWMNRLVERRGVHKATVAMAHKMAKLAWAGSIGSESLIPDTGINRVRVIDSGYR